MLPEINGIGEDRATLGPYDLLVDEGSAFIPDSSTIACRLLACQQYQAALRLIACWIAILTKPR